MPVAVSSGRVAKIRKHKNTTPHQKNHRWESFSTKISKLNSLDPLRKVRRHDLDDEDLSSTTSYFRNGLTRWADLNISKSFTNFKREVSPLCETLPQILLFQDKIMDLLATYIATQDKEALEPLLDLLIAFAHDLGVKFEQYYARSLELLVAIAGKPQEADVIEWTFAALAWLFKYLSRLLVPDLRPTYDMLSGLLGKTKHPPHINRFAAEAMSFLVKKAAAPSHRETALPRLVDHVKHDMIDLARKLARKSNCTEEDVAGDEMDAAFRTRQFGMYREGIMTMFSEAMKSAGTTLHSTATIIFETLIRATPTEESEFGKFCFWAETCCGVLTNIVHHSTPDSFQAVIDCTISLASKELEHELSKDSTTRLALILRLLGIMAGVRDGTRVSDWNLLIKTLVRALEALSKGVKQFSTSPGLAIWENVITYTTICWHQAPMDALIPSLNDFNKIMTSEPFMRWYIPFCDYLAELNGARFRSLFQRPFQKFIAAHWSEDKNEDFLCASLPRLVEHGALPQGGDKEALLLPQSWQDQIVSKFEELGNTSFPEQGPHGKNPSIWRDRCLPKYAALLRVLESTNVHPSTNASIAELLLKKLKLALRPSTSLDLEETRFIVTRGFQSYLRMSKASGSVDNSLSPLLQAAAPRFSSSVAFLEALLGYEEEMLRHKNRGSESPLSEDDPFVPSLITNLASSSKSLRMATLQLFQVLPFTPDQDSLLSTMIMVEQLPMDHNSPRAIAVHLRRLAQSYDQLEPRSWLRQAVPAYLFGMLTINLSPVWDEAAEVLKDISQSKTAAEHIFDRAFAWLQVPSPRWAPPQVSSNTSRNYSGSLFSCTHMAQLQDRGRQTSETISEPSNILLDEFEQHQSVVPPYVTNARAKALKVFSAIPSLAEKHSRKTVPFLLSLDEAHEDLVGGQVEETVIPSNDFWSLPDKKALVGVFAQFGNPKVLFKSREVYETLLNLLANREIEIQKLALKAILTWKQEGVKPYKENLEYLLDESRFKNELTVLLQGENTIQPQHRAELMPVLLRVLYGRATSKKGVASGRNGLHATRLAVIRNLSLEDIGGFLNIALGKLNGVRVVDASGLRHDLFLEEKVTPRKQVGFLNMVQTIINELGTSVDRYMEPLTNAVLYCLFSASRNLRQTEQEDDEDDDVSVENDKTSNTSLYKVARTTALKSLCALVRNNQSFDWSPYQEPIVAEIVTPVINMPPEEMAQGISWTWRLLETWSLLPRTATILAINDGVLPKIADCISFEKSKIEVRIFALGIIRNLVKLAQAPDAGSEFDGLVKAELLDPNADKILSGIGHFLRTRHDIDIRTLEACVETVVELSSVVDGSKNARNLVEISTHLLKQPSRRVSPKVKGSLLRVLEHFIALEDIHADQKLKKDVYETLASLFNFFKDKSNRESLSKVLLAFATREATVHEVAQICADLNSYVEERLDEPDYDRRLGAFNAISRIETPFTVEQWLPVLHNLVFFLNQDEEFGILCSNSADGLCKFVDAAGEEWGTEMGDAYLVHVDAIIMSAVQSGVKEPSEAVRRETIRLLGHLVAKLSNWSAVQDLIVLLPSAETDASKAFFSNILTPAVSKQLQAVQMLAAANERNELSSKNISHIFIPLLEHFIWGRAGNDDHGLGAQAAATIASLASSLEWSQYRAIMRRYISYLVSKPELHKQVIRLLDKVVESLVSAVDRSNSAEMEVDEGAESSTSTQRRLTSTLPAKEKLADEFAANFTPSLLNHLHDKNEETVSARVPVAVILVKLLRLLPDYVLSQQLPGVLTDICHILRSKSWESREMSRSTLAKIACILGPASFGFILKELRGALKSGTQLHILAYTMHTLLLAVMPEFQQGDLDYCLESMVAVIMDDIFGVSGQEKDAEDYNSKTKEVKSSKSQDSMELIASTASITQLVELVKPLQALLLEKLDLRMVRKIDELLNRIASGLQKNPAADSRDTLIFCYEVVQEVYNSRKPKSEAKIDPRLRRYLVQKGAKREDRGAASKHTHKLMRFAIDILRSVLRKHDSLRTPSNINGFLPIIGDAVVMGEEEVKIAAFKLLTVLVRVPSKTNELDDLYKVASKDSIKCIAQALSTTTELSQTALKLLAVILRDRREVIIKDAAIDTLLTKLKDDLTEPLYRHVTFNFLRSVLDRKIETAIVYDTLDYVGTVMITNDDKDTRDLARGAFFQFLREYPQKKSRWTKQIEFILANLKYPREGGRLSVMEILHLLLMKSADDFVKEIAATCFFPLVLLVGNDDSERCRLAAGELIKEIFRKADKDRLHEFLVRLRSWVDQDGNMAVLKLALQVYGYYFEAKDPSQKDKKDLKLLTVKVASVFTDELDWEFANTALNLVHILLDKHPERLLSQDTTELWTGAFGCISHERTAVKVNAVKLLSRYLADFAAGANEIAQGQPIAGSHGQKLEQDQIAQIIRMLLGILRDLEVDETLAQAGVQILIFLSRFLATTTVEDDESSSSDDEDAGEDDFFKAGEEPQEEVRGVMSLRYMFWRLAGIIRREVPPRAPALVSKLAAAEAMEALVSQGDIAVLTSSAQTILRPLRNLTDPAIPAPFSTDEVFKTRYDSLKNKAQSIMDAMQTKLGTAEYTKQLLAVGETVRERRMARSSKRKVEAVTAPDRYEKDKRRKMDRKKDRRKERGMEHRNARRRF